jgi:DNA primase
MQTTDQRDDVTARIKEQADIVQVIGEHIDLKRSGARFLGICPFHGEKTPSFSVHPGQQFFHCFGCGESGDVFSFVMKQNGIDFPGALKILAEKYNVELPKHRKSKEEEERNRKRKDLFTVTGKSVDIYASCLLDGKMGEVAREYLKKRGVSRELVEKFRLGYAPAVEDGGWNFLGAQFSETEKKSAVEAGLLVSKERGGTYDRFRDRILFPIFNISGQVCGFGGRIVGEGQPKYMNSPESLIFDKGRLLLGLYQQKEQIRKQNRAILVEGNFDMISLVAKGCENVVAPLGTALTREQLRLIKRFAEEATLLFDGDVAGGKAAVRGVPLFLAEQVAGRVAVLPEGHDPDTFVRERGLGELSRLLENAESLPEFVISGLVKQYGLDLDGKRRIVEELVPLVKAAVSPLQRGVFVSHFAEKLSMPVEQLEQYLQGAVRDIRPEKVEKLKKSPAMSVQPLTIPQRQLVEYMILNPVDFPVLAAAGVRDCLAGSVGEILFLELEKLLKKDSGAEPEELLTQLPEGVERQLVAGMLLSPPAAKYDSESETNELDDQLGYLRRVVLKRGAEQLQERINEAQVAGDLTQLQLLISEKMDITRKLHSEEG